VGAYSTTSTQKTKKGAPLTKSEHRPANRSKGVRPPCSRVCATPLPLSLMLCRSFVLGVAGEVYAPGAEPTNGPNNAIDGRPGLFAEHRGRQAFSEALAIAVSPEGT
jgi:hypothetical protein